jgi:hypothetical protein
MCDGNPPEGLWTTHGSEVRPKRTGISRTVNDSAGDARPFKVARSQFAGASGCQPYPHHPKMKRVRHAPATRAPRARRPRSRAHHCLIGPARDSPRPSGRQLARPPGPPSARAFACVPRRPPSPRLPRLRFPAPLQGAILLYRLARTWPVPTRHSCLRPCAGHPWLLWPSLPSPSSASSAVPSSVLRVHCVLRVLRDSIFRPPV